MLKSSVLGFVCAIAIVGSANGGCSAAAPSSPSDACEQGDTSCKTSPSTNSKKDAGSATPSMPTPSSPSGRDAGLVTHTDGSAPVTPTPTGDGGLPLTEDQCKTVADGMGCFDCCFSFHKTGGGLDFQTYGGCVCETPGACKTECGATEFCKQGGTAIAKDDACDKCLTKEDTGTCGMKATAACAADADCKAFNACVTASSCQTKK